MRQSGFHACSIAISSLVLRTTFGAKARANAGRFSVAVKNWPASLLRAASRMRWRMVSGSSVGLALLSPTLVAVVVVLAGPKILSTVWFDTIAGGGVTLPAVVVDGAAAVVNVLGLPAAATAVLVADWVGVVTLIATAWAGVAAKTGAGAICCASAGVAIGAMGAVIMGVSRKLATAAAGGAIGAIGAVKIGASRITATAVLGSAIGAIGALKTGASRMGVTVALGAAVAAKGGVMSGASRKLVTLVLGAAGAASGGAISGASRRLVMVVEGVRTGVIGFVSIGASRSVATAVLGVLTAVSGVVNKGVSRRALTAALSVTGAIVLVNNGASFRAATAVLGAVVGAMVVVNSGASRMGATAIFGVAMGLIGSVNNGASRIGVTAVLGAAVARVGGRGCDSVGSVGCTAVVARDVADGAAVLLPALLVAICGCALGLMRNEKTVEDARPARLSELFVAFGSAIPIKIMITACSNSDARKNSLVAALVRELKDLLTSWLGGDATISNGVSALAAVNVCAVFGGKISAACAVTLTLNPVPNAR